jgi:hypothetical protein
MNLREAPSTLDFTRLSQLPNLRALSLALRSLSVRRSRPL